MADNITLNAGSGGATLATDEIAGPKHVQFVKLMDGTADGVGIIPGDATNGLDVDITRLPADAVASGTITAGGQTLALDVARGEGAVGIQLSGTWVATLDFEVTVDGTNWVAWRAHDGSDAVLQTTANGVFAIPAGPFDQVRVRASAFTSGTVSVSIKGCRGATPIVVTSPLPAGTNNIGDVDVLSLPAIPAGTNNIGDVDVLSLPAIPAGTNNIGDVDVLTLPVGTVAGASSLPAGANNIGDVDVLTLPAGTVAGGTSLPAGVNNIGDVDVVTLPAIPAGTNNIGDVDIASAPTGASAVQTQGTAAAAAAPVGNPVQVGGSDGSVMRALSVDSSGRPQVVVATALPAGTNNIGDVDVVTLPALPAGTNNIGDVDVLTLPALPAGTNNIGDVDILTVAAGVSIEAQGDVAHDAAVSSSNPVLMGARANDNEPTAVNADADAVHLWADRLGRLVTVAGHPSPEAPVTVNGSGAGVSVIAAPGAGVSIYVKKGSLHNSNAAVQLVSLRDGAAGTIRFTAPLAASGGGTKFDFGERGWKLTANTALVMDAAAATAYCNVEEYCLAP